MFTSYEEKLYHYEAELLLVFLPALLDPRVPAAWEVEPHLGPALSVFVRRLTLLLAGMGYFVAGKQLFACNCTQRRRVVQKLIGI